MPNSWGLELGDNITFAFSLTKTKNFYEELNNWIGDVFYDILPEKGFDLRDEQVFMAFQLERAFKEKKVMFAEAGVGTGKTLVYLLLRSVMQDMSENPLLSLVLMKR